MNNKTLALALSAALLSAEMGSSSTAIDGVTFGDLVKCEQLLKAKDLDGLKSFLDANPALLEIEGLGEMLREIVTPKPLSFFAAIGLDFTVPAGDGAYKQALFAASAQKSDYEGIY